MTSLISRLSRSCPRRWPQRLFLLITVLGLGWGASRLAGQQLKHNETRRQLPYIFLGRQFEGLQAIIGEERYVGYLTDKDLDDKLPAAQFAQAQYTLAPVILDFGNPDHAFVLIDATSDAAAAILIEDNGLQPLKQNNFGIILAEGTE